MGLLRSEQMKHGTLVVPVDRARDFIDLIGEKTTMQFEDMNEKNMNRPYKKYIQRLDEMERILRFLTDEVTRIPEAHIVKDNLDDFLEHASDYKLDEVEAQLKRIHLDFVQFKENNSNLLSNRNAALEELYVVRMAAAQIGMRSNGRAQTGGDDENDATRSLLADDESRRRNGEAMLSNIAGVIPQDEQHSFSRALFRATRGNTFVQFQEIHEPMQDPKTGKDVKKSVFVVYFQDQRSASLSAMGERVTRICHTSSVNTYVWPTSTEDADARKTNINAQVADQEQLLRAHDSFVLEAAQSMIEASRLGGNSLIEDWRLFSMKEKAIKIIQDPPKCSTFGHPVVVHAHPQRRGPTKACAW